MPCWPAAPFKARAGEVVFYDATQRVAHETIAFAAGQCVGYHETFESGAGGDGAYVCQLSITAPAFELRSGGPAALAAVVGAAVVSLKEQASPDLGPTREFFDTQKNSLVGPNFNTVAMDSDYDGEETGAVWGTSVKYLSAQERKQYELLVSREGLLVDAENRLFDTRGAGTVTGKGKAIFVMSEAGNIYASLEQQAGIFHHSSFLAGAPVAAAGEIEVIDGVVKTLSNRSGHYTPDQSYTHQFIEQLWRKGVKNTDEINIVDFEH